MERLITLAPKQDLARAIYCHLSAVTSYCFQLKMFDIFLMFAQNIDCGYMFETPSEGGSNEYLQSLIYSKCIPLYT